MPANQYNTATVDGRAGAIYDYLRGRLNRGTTLAELLAATGLENSAKTRQAIRRAREMATADGLNFPPAVPATGYVYVVTDAAELALDPTLHTTKIEAGLHRLNTVQYAHLRQTVGTMAGWPAAERQAAVDIIDAFEDRERAYAAATGTIDDMTAGLAAMRSNRRRREALSA
jgi:hypothetical protein